MKVTVTMSVSHPDEQLWEWLETVAKDAGSVRNVYQAKQDTRLWSGVLQQGIGKAREHTPKGRWLNQLEQLGRTLGYLRTHWGSTHANADVSWGVKEAIQNARHHRQQFERFA